MLTHNREARPLLSLHARREALTRLSQGIRNFEPRILEALRTDLGKPELEAYVSEIFVVQSEIKLALKNLKRWTKPRRVKEVYFTWPSRSEVRREPLGRVLIMGPWNYPFQLMLTPLVSALAAGNTALLKPSPYAPATESLLRDLVARCFSPDLVSVAASGPQETLSLLEHPFDMIFFTGGKGFGQTVLEKAAKHLCPVVLELGGKSPCIVDEGLNPLEVAKRIARGKFFNAGQTCVAPDYVCVPRREHHVYVKAFEEALTLFYGGDARLSPDYARIVHAGHFSRLEALLCPKDEPVALGAPKPSELYFPPTLLTKATFESPAMQEEIFGPILPILTYEHVDDLAAPIRALGHPLALYVFSNRRAFQETVLDKTPSGSVCVNDVLMQLANPHLPFGGVGPSGMGRYRGEAGFQTFTYARAVMKRSLWVSPFQVYPPYGKTLAWLKKVLA